MEQKQTILNFEESFRFTHLEKALHLFCISDWVLLFGPETFEDEGLYEYAVVSNERRGALFVLARDVPGFRAEYQEEVCF